MLLGAVIRHLINRGVTGVQGRWMDAYQVDHPQVPFTWKLGVSCCSGGYSSAIRHPSLLSHTCSTAHLSHAARFCFSIYIRFDFGQIIYRDMSGVDEAFQ